MHSRISDERALIAAANNADYYELTYKAHGLSFQRDACMFLSWDRPPPYHSSMLALDPAGTARQMEAINGSQSRRNGSFGLKDGFCQLDLEGEGFRLLFSASWVWAPAGRLGSSPMQDWKRITTEAALIEWEKAWAAAGSPSERRLFVEPLLSEPRIAFFGRRSGTKFDAGFIINRSDHSVGLSNLFSTSADEALYREAASITSLAAPRLPIVGYARGAALDAMRQCGFEEVGQLRVWQIGD